MSWAYGALVVVAAAAAAAWLMLGAMRRTALRQQEGLKMVYADRVLIIDWQLGDTVLRSGFVLSDEVTARGWASWLAAPTNGSLDQEESRR